MILIYHIIILPDKVRILGTKIHLPPIGFSSYADGLIHKYIQFFLWTFKKVSRYPIFTDMPFVDKHTLNNQILWKICHLQIVQWWKWISRISLGGVFLWYLCLKKLRVGLSTVGLGIYMVTISRKLRFSLLVKSVSWSRQPQRAVSSPCEIITTSLDQNNTRTDNVLNC